MNRKIWKSDSLSGKPCARCGGGTLKTVGKEKAYKEFETVDSMKENLISLPLGTGSFIFRLDLSCNNCKEPYIAVGEIGYVKKIIIGKYQLYKEYKLNYVFPPLHIIEIPEDLPDTVVFHIVDSFAVYFMDLNACANKLRIACEALMDYYESKGIDTNPFNKNGDKNYLNARLQKLEISKPKLAEKLRAIKWIGNAGSHDGYELTDDDILDGYEVLEWILNEEELNKKVDAINLAKGPINKAK